MSVWAKAIAGPASNAAASVAAKTERTIATLPDPLPYDSRLARTQTLIIPKDKSRGNRNRLGFLE